MVLSGNSLDPIALSGYLKWNPHPDESRILRAVGGGSVQPILKFLGLTGLRDNLYPNGDNSPTAGIQHLRVVSKRIHRQFFVLSFLISDLANMSKHGSGDFFCDYSV